MQPHPDWVATVLPRGADLPGFRLTPLGPAVAEEDFEAVTGSAGVLEGVFGGVWPVGLTLEDNRIDMGWHDREFTARRSFAWVIRAPDGTYQGCAYIYPDIGARGRAEVVIWFCDLPDRVALMTRFRSVFADWLSGTAPSGIALRWTTSPAVTGP